MFSGHSHSQKNKKKERGRREGGGECRRKLQALGFLGRKEKKGPIPTKTNRLPKEEKKKKGRRKGSNKRRANFPNLSF